MTTLTIQIPDNKASIIAEISNITDKAGLSIIVENDDEGLSEDEFQSLKNACEEAVLIKKGLIKAIPASELWND